MVRTVDFKEKMFIMWDNSRLDELEMRIGKNLKDKAIAKMLDDYVTITVPNPERSLVTGKVSQFRLVLLGHFCFIGLRSSEDYDHHHDLTQCRPAGPHASFLFLPRRAKVPGRSSQELAMQLVHILFVTAALLLTICDPAAATDQIKIMQAKKLNEVQSNDDNAILTYKRSLRGDNDADVQDEERSLNNFVLSFQTWFVNTFSRNTLEKMLKNTKFRTKIFERWDQYKVGELRLKIGESILSDEAIAKMFQTYVGVRELKDAVKKVNLKPLILNGQVVWLHPLK
ncbi:unnamed protein product [Phytophthora lilii]|uniref:RxLR effector protein n=1 Tax=Phytophthora lilii TaxID=2077276 RepID=A0A9W6TM01_9STRA|nr:unnamed protein product [Phytophthora lilii]